jgi:riboflavin-specific deaminase-like protein
MGLIENLPELAQQLSRQEGRPLVTLCYAQSLDGSITAQRGTPLQLSSIESFRFVHRLRAASEAILVGIGTVLADDPQLTVRLVPGRHPQPIVLDSQLRFPLSARLLKRAGPKPWIYTTTIDSPRQIALEAAGARVIPMPGKQGSRLSLPDILSHLTQNGVQSLMVEGGARVITSFLQSRLVDYLVLTLVPVFVGGLRSLEAPLFSNQNSSPPANTQGLPRLTSVVYEQHGDDLVIIGRVT